MNEKKLKENIEKIKQLLTLPDYDKIDAGVELAVSLEEPKIFETLLDGCSLESSRPKLNEWMKSLITSCGKLINKPTGYYVFLNLIINAPDNAKIHTSLKPADIKKLNLTKCYLSDLPKNFSKFDNLEKLYLECNKLGPSIPIEIFKLKNLIGLYLGYNAIKTIPDEISTLENLQLLAFGDNSISELSDKLSNLKKLKHLDISSNAFYQFPDVIYQSKNLINFCCFGYDDNDNPLDGETLNKINHQIPNINILEGVQCNACSVWLNPNSGVIQRHDGYFCSSCDPDWNDIYGRCDYCNEYIAPSGFVDIEEWDIYKWYHDQIWESWDMLPSTVIIKEKNGTLIDKTICFICQPNIPKTDIPSYADAEQYAEENFETFDDFYGFTYPV